MKHRTVSMGTGVPRSMAKRRLMEAVRPHKPYMWAGGYFDYGEEEWNYGGAVSKLQIQYVIEGSDNAHQFLHCKTLLKAIDVYSDWWFRMRRDAMR